MVQSTVFSPIQGATRYPHLTAVLAHSPPHFHSCPRAHSLHAFSLFLYFMRFSSFSLLSCRLIAFHFVLKALVHFTLPHLSLYLYLDSLVYRGAVHPLQLNSFRAPRLNALKCWSICFWLAKLALICLLVTLVFSLLVSLFVLWR